MHTKMWLWAGAILAGVLNTGCTGTMPFTKNAPPPKPAMTSQAPPPSATAWGKNALAKASIKDAPAANAPAPVTTDPPITGKTNAIQPVSYNVERQSLPPGNPTNLLSNAANAVSNNQGPNPSPSPYNNNPIVSNPVPRNEMINRVGMPVPAVAPPEPATIPTGLPVPAPATMDVPPPAPPTPTLTPMPPPAAIPGASALPAPTPLPPIKVRPKSE